MRQNILSGRIVKRCTSCVSIRDLSSKIEEFSQIIQELKVNKIEDDEKDPTFMAD